LSLIVAYFWRSGITSRNQPKSLSGIETQFRRVAARSFADSSPNQPKSLSGIETPECSGSGCTKYAGINLNPYQGLKLTDALSSLASNAPEST
jgi:hypothetical protein